MKTLGCTVLT